MNMCSSTHHSNMYGMHKFLGEEPEWHRTICGDIGHICRQTHTTSAWHVCRVAVDFAKFALEASSCFP